MAGLMIAAVEYNLLKRISPGEPSTMNGSAYAGKSKLKVLLGSLLDDIQDKTVVDFGCGAGHETCELAIAGARKVIGIDINPAALERARNHAKKLDVDDRCTFSETLTEPADLIVSIDSFEHFHDPAAILKTMASMCDKVVISFGPTWLHPYGGHLFSVFPWAHLLFSEESLLRWRSTIRSDGARRFHEVEGGLNCITIRKFESIVKASPFKFDYFEEVPIRPAAPFHNRLTREFFTSIVRCRLVLRSG